MGVFSVQQFWDGGKGGVDGVCEWPQATPPPPIRPAANDLLRTPPPSGSDRNNMQCSWARDVGHYSVLKSVLQVVTRQVNRQGVRAKAPSSFSDVQALGAASDPDTASAYTRHLQHGKLHGKKLFGSPGVINRKLTPRS